jgi:hypothetical protein
MEVESFSFLSQLKQPSPFPAPSPFCTPAGDREGER